MKHLLFFMLILWGSTSWAQDIQLPLQVAGNMRYVQLGVNGMEGTFIFDTGADGITINKGFFDNLKRRGLISDQDITGTTTAILANGSSITANTFLIQSLQIGSETLNQVTGILIPNNSAPMLVGQNIFEPLGPVMADFGKNLLIIKRGSTASGGGGGIPINPTNGGGVTGNGNAGNNGGGNGNAGNNGGGNGNAGTTQTVSQALKEIYRVKLIPCTAADVAHVAQLAQLMQADPNFSAISIEIEPNVPPQKAAVKLTKGAVTIRYFDLPIGQLIQTSEFLMPIDVLISSSPYNYPQSAQGENMLPLFNNKPIPNYVEIWIKQQ